MYLQVVVNYLLLRFAVRLEWGCWVTNAWLFEVCCCFCCLSLCDMSEKALVKYSVPRRVYIRQITNTESKT